MKIDSGVNLPERHTYPFGKMKVGQSFTLNCDHFTTARKVRSAAWNYGEYHDKKFQVHYSAVDETVTCKRTR